ncbi:uncharacterized protein NPIL_654491 [Nephila pilipes]|uniref:SMB domain-containing protein n=1 Tax=Nephila pilipes TaxID=299642 RepID=A0A8X6MTK2_NEPPI|nr:uncharacterized protein NPIL_654491 [Nephila pilipes]
MVRLHLVRRHCKPAFLSCPRKNKRELFLLRPEAGDTSRTMMINYPDSKQETVMPNRCGAGYSYMIHSKTGHFPIKMKNIWRIKLSKYLSLLAFFNAVTVLWDVCSADVSYEELVKMGAQCDPFDNCRQPRGTDQLNKYNCDCDSSCVVFDTCCVDSPYRNESVAPVTGVTCRKVYDDQSPAVYMVDSCTNPDLSSEMLCGTSAEESNDLFLIIPVTSVTTRITYRNYFCALCNENTEDDQLVLWDFQAEGHSERLNDSTMPDFTYDAALKSWRIVNDSSVKISIRIPDNLRIIVKTCSVDLISNCSNDWPDDSVAEKCAAYMAKVTLRDFFYPLSYRNPHCALCNFENVELRECDITENQSTPFSGKKPWIHSFLRPSNPDYDEPHRTITDPRYSVSQIPFIRLFQLHNKPKCGLKMIYDKFSKKCRCNSQRSSMKDGACVNKT